MKLQLEVDKNEIGWSRRSKTNPLSRLYWSGY